MNMIRLFLANKNGVSKVKDEIEFLCEEDLFIRASGLVDRILQVPQSAKTCSKKRDNHLLLDPWREMIIVKPFKVDQKNLLL